MVTFTVAFGVKGDLVDTDADKWPNPPLKENSDWGNPFNSNASKIDDLWHAAYNSKGTYVSAQDPKEVVKELLQHNLAMDMEKELHLILENRQHRLSMIGEYDALRNELGDAGTSARVAEKMIALLFSGNT